MIDLFTPCCNSTNKSASLTIAIAGGGALPIALYVHNGIRNQG
ncbi:MAG TPA: hypothetical protein VE956_14700 [Nodularia sp. (in: cyanobacteria)]|nr:hypothetical protein [Nodularia sp. (in: cyanobacteria)]